MISLIYLLIIAGVSNTLAVSDVSTKYEGCPETKNGNIVSAYQRLEIAEEMIKSAKQKVNTSKQLIAKPMDCEDLLNSGVRESGVYLVWPQNRLITGYILVYCDMETDGGGWTVIQRRGNFSNVQDDFYQDWETYKKGFGNLNEEFWLGNDNIYALSNQRPYSIRFDLGDFDGGKTHAVYKHFWIGEESDNYTLHVSGYNGNAGDSFSTHSGYQFTTKDKKHDDSIDNCAVKYRGAWWFDTCDSSHLNGEYTGKVPPDDWYGIIWEAWKGSDESLASTEMKIRRKPNYIK